MMNKKIALLLILLVLPTVSALGNRWDLIFSDGTTTINGTDVCLESGTCLSSAGGGTGNSSWNEVLADTLYYDIDNPYSYYNSTNPPAGGNSSWNETHADTLYIAIGDEGNLNVNSSDYWDDYDTANTTWFQNIAGALSLKLAELTSYLDTWLGTKDTDDLTEGSTNLYDNRTFNQTLTDSLYSSGSDNSSWNESYADTLYYGIDNPSEFYNNITNFTGTLTDGKICIYDATSQIINCTYTDQTGASGNPKAGDGIYLYNDTDTMYFNATKMNATGDLRYAPINYGDDWNKTYADTLYADISVTGDNSSWNETHADGLYIAQGSEGDLNVNSSDYWDTLDTYNDTQMDNNAGTLSITIAWFSGLFDTLFGTKDTDDLTEGSTNLYQNQSFNETHTDSLYADISVTGDNSSWNETWADTLYAPINYGDDWNKTYADTLYYLNTNPYGFWNDTYATFNKTYADTLYAAAGASGNTSWNETWANTLYIATGDEGNLNVNSSDYWDDYDTANATWFQSISGALSLKLTELTSYLDTWLGGKDTDDLTEGSVNLYDNRTFNQTLTDSLYSSGSDNSSWNESYADTLYYGIDNPSEFYNNITNFTGTLTDGKICIYDASQQIINCTYTDQTGVSGNPKAGDLVYLYNDTDTMYFNATKMNATGDLRYAPINYGDDWNETYADTLYYLDSNPYGFWNDTYATFNKTYADTLYADISVTGGNSSWNETYADTLYYGISNPYSFYNSTDFDIGDYYLNTNPYGFWNDTYATFNKTYADTLYADISVTGGNSSWNETYADTLYYNIGNSYSYWNDTYASFNETYADTLYADISITDGNTSWNETWADTLYYGISNPYSFYNSTDFDITDYFTKAEVLGFSYYNATDFVITDYSTTTAADLLYAPINYGDDWNKTYADTLYADISVTGGNSSWNETYADTLYAPIAVPASTVTAGTFGTGNYVMDTNLTVEKLVFETDASHFMEDNATCIFIRGSTSVLEIC